MFSFSVILMASWEVILRYVNATGLIESVLQICVARLLLDLEMEEVRVCSTPTSQRGLAFSLSTLRWESKGVWRQRLEVRHSAHYCV
jgi:hypothetical protein